MVFNFMLPIAIEALVLVLLLFAIIGTALVLMGSESLPFGVARDAGNNFLAGFLVVLPPGVAMVVPKDNDDDFERLVALAFWALGVINAMDGMPLLAFMFMFMLVFDMKDWGFCCG